MTVDANRVSACRQCGQFPKPPVQRLGLTGAPWQVSCSCGCASCYAESAGQAVDAWNALCRSPSLSGGEVVLYGPYGWLNGHRGLSEDSWGLENDPVADSGEYFAIPLYAKVDPFVEVGIPAASPAPLEGVRVKPLEWDETFQDRGDGSSELSGWEAETPGFSVFYTVEIEVSGFALRRQDLNVTELGTFTDPDEAKAAAQADFDQRIRSALASPPSPAQVTDALRHAFRNANESDWSHLFAVLPDTGRGRFWQAVMAEARTALQSQPSKGA